MTEGEWLASTDVLPLIRWVGLVATQRKFRLYLCGGCQHIKHLLFSPHSIRAVEVAERLADGLADQDEVAEAVFVAESPTFGCDFDEGFWQKYPEAPRDTPPRLVELGALSASALTGGKWEVNEPVRQRLLAAAEIAYSCLFSNSSQRPYPYEELISTVDWPGRWISTVDWPGRWMVDCVFGNPFRPVPVDPSWLRWSDGTVAKIAQAIYDQRRFEDLPILADALLDAGCDNEDILSHCRAPGPHVRGCWVVDLLLGKV